MLTKHRVDHIHTCEQKDIAIFFESKVFSRQIDQDFTKKNVSFEIFVSKSRFN